MRGEADEQDGLTSAGVIVVLSATPFEAAPLRDHLRTVPVALVVSGIGKANAAAAVAGTVAGSEATVLGILQLGIGGAYPGTGVKIGDVLLAHSEFDLDLGLRSQTAWSGLESLGFAAFDHHGELNRIGLQSEMLEAVRRATGLRSAAFATSDSVTSDEPTAVAIARRHEVSVESMEGVAAAQVAAGLGVPFVELRGVSNVVGERDKRRWKLAEAIAAVTAAAADVVTVMWEQTTRATKESR